MSEVSAKGTADTSPAFAAKEQGTGMAVESAGLLKIIRHFGRNTDNTCLNIAS